MGDVAFHRPLRAAVTGLAGFGGVMAASAAVLAYVRVGARDGLLYTSIAIVLAAATMGIARGVRWLVVVSLAFCAGQVFAIAGTVLELVYGVDAGKAAQLRALGFDPALGVALNLAYSVVGLALFGWFAARWRRHRALG